MKVDAINLGTYTGGVIPAQNIKAEETNSSLDEFDDTRIANKKLVEPKVDNPIERKQGTVEDLISLQKSTEKMAQSYGFANVAEAQAATTPTAPTESSSAVSAVSSVSSGGINA